MLIQCDASGLEWRTLLELANETVGINEILQGEDTHEKNRIAFDLPSRLISKIFLFRTIYRGSGWAFANDPDFMHVSSDAKFWEGMNEKFYAKYKNIDATHKRWTEDVKAGRPIEGPMGRSWKLEMGRDRFNNIKLPLTQLSNFPVQGTGADIMSIARISSYKRIKAAEIPCLFVSSVHDSIVLDTQEQYLDDIAQIFHGVFKDIPTNIKNIFGYDWKVPMTCECKFGKNMKEMEKVS